MENWVRTMIFAVRDGEDLSLKDRFIVQLFELNPNIHVISISRKDVPRLKKQWANDKIELGTSFSSILAYYILTMLKSPRDLSNGMKRRLFKKDGSQVLVGEGFLSVISQVLYHYFASSAKTDAIKHYLEKIDSQNIFLIDEFLSINTLDIRMLKRYGHIIYVSQDVAYNRYGFQDSLIAKNLMRKLEHDAIALSDMVIASSERDRLKYLEMGAKKAVFYPNIYPILEFELGAKDQSPSICIISREHWGSKSYKSLEDIFKALSLLDYTINVYVIGVKPKFVPKNIRIKHYDFLPSKLDYLNVLSKSWIGINIGFHLAGSNERKYDYALAGQVVLSDSLGARGDLLPHEYAFVDSQDLAAKIEQLLQFGKDRILLMGVRNREQALFLAEKQKEQIRVAINDLVHLFR
jgi:hypothetical protein